MSKDVLENCYDKGLNEPLLIVADGIKNLGKDVIETDLWSKFELCREYIKGLEFNVKYGVLKR